MNHYELDMKSVHFLWGRTKVDALAMLVLVQWCIALATCNESGAVLLKQFRYEC